MHPSVTKQAHEPPSSGSEKSKALLVLGMHRSGTSAVTRVMNLMGAALNRDILQSMPGVNDTGFWESLDIVLIHDELLKAAGSVWDDTSSLSSAWLESDATAQFKERIQAILRRDFADAPLFAIKDPRLCRLGALWRPILEKFGAEPLIVMPVRNPLEVAASLEARDQFVPAKSMLLWLRHVLDAELFSRAYARSFVSYEDFLRDWQAGIKKIGRDLGLTWPRSPDDGQGEVASFLREALRHHAVNLEEIEARADVIDWVKRTYAALLQATHSGSVATNELDAVRAELDHAEGLFGPVLAHERRARDQIIAALKDDLVQRDIRFAVFEQYTGEVKQHAAAMELRAAVLEQHAAEVEGHAGEVERHAGEMQLRVAEVQQHAADQTVKIVRLEDDVRHREEDIAALQSSASWRITAPLRFVGRLVRSLLT